MKKDNKTEGARPRSATGASPASDQGRLSLMKGKCAAHEKKGKKKKENEEKRKENRKRSENKRKK